MKVEVVKEGYAYDTFHESHYEDLKQEKAKPTVPKSNMKKFSPQINDGIPLPPAPKTKWVKPNEIDEMTLIT